jgi:hypothetical protein
VRALTGVGLLIGFFYLFWTGGMALRSYWHLSSVVDQALERARGGAAPVRAVILRGAADSGVPIAPGDVVVDEDRDRVSVQLRWAWPVVSWQGEPIVRIPLSLRRSGRR